MLLAACQPAQSTLPPQATGESSVEITGTASPTESELPEVRATATPLPDPLRLSLPTPGQVPVSAWRPPLYSVPWALNENDHFYFSRPVAANEINWPLSAYRYGGTNFGEDIPHTGVDIVTPVGTPVLAAEAGRIVWSDFGLFLGIQDVTDPYGLAVVVEHDFGHRGQLLYTVYAHLSESLVVRGQRVERGETIALSGQSGIVTAAHLHFEVRIGDNSYFTSLNPELWLAPPQGWGVLAGSVTNVFLEPLVGHEIKVISQETKREWWVNTYGSAQTVNGDPYYRENFALSDLPAGTYRLLLQYLDEEFETFVEILPGAVTYFTFRGLDGFSLNLPRPRVPTNVPIFVLSETATPSNTPTATSTRTPVASPTP
jgi:hypothetical protein